MDKPQEDEANCGQNQTNVMIINYTHNYQFRTRMCFDGVSIEFDQDQDKLLASWGQ